ncbi:MAG: hypothetical protein M3317_04535, partial [Actinomycetota bacterium]|nr:hypothetical protein [Actinomycetota bacterium]
YRETGGREAPLRVSDTKRLEYAVVGADLSLYGGKPQDPGVEEVLFGSWQLRALGSAGIRGAWLAAGYLDVSLGTRNTAWDYAPTVLLVSEAGGRATDLSGEPWSQQQRLGWQMLARGSKLPAVHRSMKRRLSA